MVSNAHEGERCGWGGPPRAALETESPRQWIIRVEAIPFREAELGGGPEPALPGGRRVTDMRQAWTQRPRLCSLFEETRGPGGR